MTSEKRGRGRREMGRCGQVRGVTGVVQGNMKLEFDIGQRNESSGWIGTGSRAGGRRAHLTAAEVQVQIVEVTVEGEALEQCPVGGRSAGPPLPLTPFFHGSPLDAPQPCTHPT